MKDKLNALFEAIQANTEADGTVNVQYIADELEALGWAEYLLGPKKRARRVIKTCPVCRSGLGSLLAKYQRAHIRACRKADHEKTAL